MHDQIEALLAAADSRPATPWEAPQVDPADDDPAQSDRWAPRVMVADDDSAFRAMIRGWLSDLGIADVVEARDGAWAVELATRTRPDLILMDLRMPNMNGIEATRRVRMILPAKGFG